MANDIDMWNDIEALEKMPEFEMLAKNLHLLYILKFIEFDDKRAERYRNVLKKRYPKFKSNYW